MRSVEKARWQDNDLACVRPQSALTFLKYAAMRMGGAVVSVCGSEGGFILWLRNGLTLSLEPRSRLSRSLTLLAIQ
jgi:hypothetical protein